MSATFLSLQTDLQFSFRDTEVANLGIPLATYKSAINRAVRRINAKTLFYEANDYITTDGANYAYTLGGSHPASFLAIRTAYSTAGLIDGAIDIGEIRRLYANGDIVAGNPTKYAISQGNIYFNRIPPASPVIYMDYCKVPLAMVNDTDVPCPTVGALTTSTCPAIAEFDGLIVVAAKIELMDDLGMDVSGLSPLFDRRLAEFVNLVEGGGKHQTLGSQIKRSRL